MPWGRLAAIWPTTSELPDTSWNTAQIASEVEEGSLSPLPTWKEAKSRGYFGTLALGARLETATSENWPKAAVLSDIYQIRVSVLVDACGKSLTHVHVGDQIQRSG